MDTMPCQPRSTKRKPAKRIRPTRTIVLAWYTTRFNGIRHVPVPHACVWMNEGTPGDETKLRNMLTHDDPGTLLPDDAKAATIMIYGLGDADPLGDARSRMIRVYESVMAPPRY
jgi:hypothetical protein